MHTSEKQPHFQMALTSLMERRSPIAMTLFEYKLQMGHGMISRS